MDVVFATMRWGLSTLPAAALIFCGTTTFAAESVDPSPAAEPGQSAEPSRADEPNQPAQPNQPAEPKLLGGDLGGLRTGLAAAGIELGISYIGETLGVVSGGVRRGFVYEGQVGVSLHVDLDKLAGWSGARAHVNAIDVHGRGPSRNLLGGNLMVLSGIEALPAVRLYKLWLDQSLLDDRLSIRFGQLAGDDEFAISNTAGGLINSTFGFPLITSANMTGGGPAYPLPTPGVRVQVKPASDVTLHAAVFSGNPGGQGCFGNPQLCNPSGTTFSFSGGALWLGEAQYAVNTEKTATGLPGTYKLGGWRETGTFLNQFTGALDRSGDWGIYGIADQMVWRQPGNDDQSLNVFVRAGGVPSDRNLVSWYVDGGLGFKAPLADRSDDVLTLGFAYGRISDAAVRADRTAGPPTPVRDLEAVIELAYSASIAPGWTVQPDLQYVIHPGGNLASPTGTGTIGNALVLGLRTTMAF
jgi:porin